MGGLGVCVVGGMETAVRPASRGQQLVSPEGVLSPLESYWALCCVDIASHGIYWPHCLSFNCENSSSHPSTPLRPCFLPDGRSSFPNFLAVERKPSHPRLVLDSQVISSRTTCFPQGIFLSALCQPLFKWIFMGS